MSGRLLWHHLPDFAAGTRTVKDLLGHRDISTTMKYAGYLTVHAVKSIPEAQHREQDELEEVERQRVIRG